MALNAGEVEVLLKLRDELSTQLTAVRDKLKGVAGGVDDAGKKTDVFAGSFAKLTASFAASTLLTQGITSLISFGKEAFTAATRVADLASKTGLSTDTIQKMAFVAETTGSTVEAFTQSAFKLSANLAGGSTSVVAAVERLGLSFSVIKRMTPEEQFNTIMVALGKMTNEGERAQTGMALFGRGFAGMAAAVAEGYVDLANKATLMSKETVAAADKFDDTWIQVKTFTKAALAETASFVWDARIPFVALGEAVGLLGKQVVKARGDIELSNPAYVDWAARMGEARDVVDKLTDGQLKQIKAAQELGATTEDLIRDFELTEDAIRVLPNRFSELSESQKKAKKEAEEHAKALEKLDVEYAKLMSDVKNANQLAIMEAEGHKLATEAINKKNAAALGWIAKQVESTKAVNDAIAWEKAYLAEQDLLTAATDRLAQAHVRAAGDIRNTFGAAIDDVTNKVSQAALTWSEAMSLTQQGKGTMTGTLNPQNNVDTPARRAEILSAAAQGRYYGPVDANGMPDFARIFPRQYADGGPTKEGPAYVHDGEYVVPKHGALVMADGGGGSGGGGGGGRTMVVQLVMADGRLLAEAIVPWFPGELRRIGVA